MIDQDGREKLRAALKQLIDGEITTYNFWDCTHELRRSNDLALSEALKHIERSIDTEPNYRLTGKNAIDIESQQAFARWDTFLKSSLIYGWPPLPDNSNFITGFAILGIPAGIAFLIVSILMFLQNDLTWGSVLLIPAVLMAAFSISILVAFDRENKNEMNKFRDAGDYDVWPFLTREEYEHHNVVL